MLETHVYSHPGHLIRRAHQRATSAFMAEARALDITPAQFAALIAVSEHPGVDQTRLSELIAFDLPTTGNVLHRLEKRGLLVRAPHATDRRTKVIALTDDGRRILAAILRANQRIRDRTLEGLDKREQKQLIRLLTRLVAHDHERLHRKSREGRKREAAAASRGATARRGRKSHGKPTRG